MDELYKEQIIEHNRNPKNFGEILNPTVMGISHNISCGDSGKLFLNIENEKIKEVTFTGIGCALSIAGFSMLTEKIKGKTIKEVSILMPANIYDMFGVVISPHRSLCAMQCFNALQDAISKIK